MDPDENLRQQLALAKKLQHGYRNLEEPEESIELEGTAEDLAELVLALDEWIRKGGFLPGAWQKGTSTTPAV